MEFRWNDWNFDHATSHGVSVEEIEALIERPRRPFPEYRGDGKWIMKGFGFGGRYIQAIYVIDKDETIYPIHARPLTDPEKRQFRRRSQK